MLWGSFILVNWPKWFAQLRQITSLMISLDRTYWFLQNPAKFHLAMTGKLQLISFMLWIVEVWQRLGQAGWSHPGVGRGWAGPNQGGLGQEVWQVHEQGRLWSRGEGKLIRFAHKTKIASHTLVLHAVGEDEGPWTLVNPIRATSVGVGGSKII